MATEIKPDTAPTPKRRMRMRWSFIIAGIAIAGAILYLVLANTGKSAQYYMTVSELHACTSCGTQTVRVAGVVATDGLTRDNAHQIIHFVVKDGGGTLPVEYGGVVPDVFKPGIQVVVEGHLTNGLFKASSLLAKCPSKFQSATPSAG
jgi:cytochrome c-type biogenesis protein CcmE